MNWYTNSLLKKAGNDNEYINSIKPSIYRKNFENKNIDIEANNINIPFFINIEARSWGIKDINMFATAIIPITLSITEWTENGNDIGTEKEILVDLKKLKIDNVHFGHGNYTVTDLEIELDKNFEIDYTQSSITFSKG